MKREDFEIIRERLSSVLGVHNGGIDILNEHRSGKNDLAYPVWSLFNLALWYDKWIAGEDGA